MNTLALTFAICLVPATAFLIWLFTPWGKEVVEGIVVMKKIKYILCACLMMASMGMEAKSMKDLLVSMPDSVVPYLNHNLRLEFAELQEMGVKAEVKNLLGETRCDGYADC